MMIENSYDILRLHTAVLRTKLSSYVSAGHL